MEAWVHSAGVVASAILFAAVGWYLTLIAKFYRLKFMRGPRVGVMQASLAVFVAGWLLRSAAFAFIPAPVSALLVLAGGAVFSWLAYSLYRTMMSIH